KPLACLVQGDIFRILLRTTTAYLRELLIAEAQWAVVLLFHELDHSHGIGLPLRRPSQHAIEDLLHLFFRHAPIVNTIFLGCYPSVRHYPPGATSAMMGR